jgi:hypothetical protein
MSIWGHLDGVLARKVSHWHGNLRIETHFQSMFCITRFVEVQSIKSTNQSLGSLTSLLPLMIKLHIKGSTSVQS